MSPEVSNHLNVNRKLAMFVKELNREFGVVPYSAKASSSTFVERGLWFNEDTKEQENSVIISLIYPNGIRFGYVWLDTAIGKPEKNTYKIMSSYVHKKKVARNMTRHIRANISLSVMMKHLKDEVPRLLKEAKSLEEWGSDTNLVNLRHIVKSSNEETNKIDHGPLIVMDREEEIALIKYVLHGQSSSLYDRGIKNAQVRMSEYLERRLRATLSSNSFESGWVLHTTENYPIVFSKYRMYPDKCVPEYIRIVSDFDDLPVECVLALKMWRASLKSEESKAAYPTSNSSLRRMFLRMDRYFADHEVITRYDNCLANVGYEFMIVVGDVDTCKQN